MIIIFIIIIIIVLIEIYSFFSNKIKNKPQEKITQDTINISDLVFINKELVESCIIDVENCYLYTTSDENIFIIKDSKFSLMEKNQIYNILDTAKLEFIFIKNNGNYYISQK